MSPLIIMLVLLIVMSVSATVVWWYYNNILHASAQTAQAASLHVLTAMQQNITGAYDLSEAAAPIYSGESILYIDYVSCPGLSCNATPLNATEYYSRRVV